MVAEFRPELMLKDIVYCLRDNCSRSSSCLRYLAYKYAHPFCYHPFIDPRNATIGEQSSEYLSNKVQCMGRGFKASMLLVHMVVLVPFVAVSRTNCHEDEAIFIATLQASSH